MDNNIYSSVNSIGGIVGRTTGGTQILNSYNIGIIEGNCAAVAGIIGNVNYGIVTLSNVYNLGEVKTAKNCVGIIGSVSQGTNVKIDNVFFSVQDKGIGEQNGILTGEMQYYDCEFIKSNEFVNILNAYTNEGEEGYPTDWNQQIGKSGN